MAKPSRAQRRIQMREAADDLLGELKKWRQRHDLTETERTSIVIRLGQVICDEGLGAEWDEMYGENRESEWMGL